MGWKYLLSTWVPKLPQEELEKEEGTFEKSPLVSLKFLTLPYSFVASLCPLFSMSQALTLYIACQIYGINQMSVQMDCYAQEIVDEIGKLQENVSKFCKVLQLRLMGRLICCFICQEMEESRSHPHVSFLESLFVKETLNLCSSMNVFLLFFLPGTSSGKTASSPSATAAAS